MGEYEVTDSTLYMSGPYKIIPTSQTTARVTDIWLAPPDDGSTTLTRKVLRTDIIETHTYGSDRLKACLIHQKRHSKKGEWKDVDAFNLAHLKAGQEAKIQLSTAETSQLHAALSHLLTIAEDGVSKHVRNFEVVDTSQGFVVHGHGQAREALQKLLTENGDEFWDELEKLRPNLFKAKMLMKLHDVREEAVSEFQRHLQLSDWTEPAWQKFFEDHTWIFGYGLSYRFLTVAVPQPHYGNMGVGGKGEQRGDFLAVSESERRFTVLIEIKTPSTPLLHPSPYRNGVHKISSEMAGAVAQIQQNAFTWDNEGSRTEKNRDTLAALGASNVRPKTFLVIGHTGQLDTREKRESFALFRNSLQTPEIITFDELCERAKHLLLNDKKQLSPVADTTTEDDDFPF